MRPAPTDGFEHTLRARDEARQREILCGVQHVDEMVRNPGTLRGTRLGRSDIETTIDLQRVAADEFAAKRLGKFDC